jgi:hypothetical protein
MIFWPRIGYSFASWLRASCFRTFQPSPFDKLRAGSSGLGRPQILAKKRLVFHEDAVMIGGGCGPAGAGHTNGAPQVPRLRS